MPVYANMQWLATAWRGAHRTVEHHDLVRVPDGEGGYRYGIFDQNAGEGLWRETFDAAEALARLRVWAHEEPTPGRLAQSQVTEAGRRLLAMQP